MYKVIITEYSSLKLLLVLITVQTCLFREDRHVAVKIVKNVHGYSEAAHEEIKVLQHLNASDPDSTQWVAKGDCTLFWLLRFL